MSHKITCLKAKIYKVLMSCLKDKIYNVLKAYLRDYFCLKAKITCLRDKIIMYSRLRLNDSRLRLPMP